MPPRQYTAGPAAKLIYAMSGSHRENNSPSEKEPNRMPHLLQVMSPRQRHACPQKHRMGSEGQRQELHVTNTRQKKSLEGVIIRDKACLCNREVTGKQPNGRWWQARCTLSPKSIPNKSHGSSRHSHGCHTIALASAVCTVTNTTE